MKHIKKLSFVLLLGLLFTACNWCNNLDCSSNNYHGQFRIIKAATGEDLVFGTHKVYDKANIKFYSLNNTDTTFLYSKAILFGGTGYDSILVVDFLPGKELAYMRLSDGDIDTLQISFKTYRTKCCGRITEISNFRFNNTTDIPGSEGTQAIKK